MSHSPDVAAAANLAVKQVFYLLGVDVDSAKSVENFRADLRFGNKLRRMADHGAMGMVGVMVVGLGAAIWHGIVSAITIKK